MATYHQLDHEVGQKTIVVGSGSVNSGTTLQQAGQFPVRTRCYRQRYSCRFPRFEGEPANCYSQGKAKRESFRYSWQSQRQSNRSVCLITQTIMPTEMMFTSPKYKV